MQNCHLSKNLHLTNLKQKECSGGQLPVSDLDNKDLLWERAGIFKKKERKTQYLICETHYDQLYTNFKKNKVCLHPAHNEQFKKKKKSTPKVVYQITRELSQKYFYSGVGKLIPTDGWICPTHKIELYAYLAQIKDQKDQPEQDDETSDEESYDNVGDFA